MTDIDSAINAAAAAVMPFESWTRLDGESGLAYAAFCVYRDLGFTRTIRKAVEGAEQDSGQWDKRYKVWRNWCGAHKWRERAADYDRYSENLKQAEIRKTIEAQAEMHRDITKKMLGVAGKKLDMMNPADLSAGNLKEWVETAARIDREGAGLVTPNGKSESLPGLSPGELPFSPDFSGI